jgi:nucleotide-binding universal stress UspA family protein
MFKNILVCLDGSQFAEQIIPYALEQASAFKSKITLLRVVSMPGIVALNIPGSPGVPAHSSSMPEHHQRDREEAKAYLKRAAQPFHERGLQVKSVTLEGPPGSTIINYASENNIDLIAIASHGHSGLRHLLFGSVAEFVVRESGVPILMIRPKH